MSEMSNEMVESEPIFGSICKELNLNSGMIKKCSSSGQGSKLREHGSRCGRGKEQKVGSRELGFKGLVKN
jgi:hypothetical protein